MTQEVNRELKTEPTWYLRQPSRRDFLKTSAFAVGALSLAGCVSNTSTSLNTGQPKKGGVLRVAFSDGQPQDTMSPFYEEFSFSPPIKALMYESLTLLDNGFQPQPLLAKSWEPSNDAKTWVFHLQPGIQFHDGSTLTAKDVVYSLQQGIDPNNSLSALVTLLGPYIKPENIKAVDDNTVRFDLEQSNVFFANALGTRYAKIYKAGTTDFTHPNGTGAFKFKSFTPGQAFAAVRHPNYWQSGKPYLDEIRVTNIPETASKVQALLSGNVDFIDNIDYTTAKQVQSSGFVPVTLKDAFWQPVSMDRKFKPFDEPRIAQAFKLAVDRQQIVNIVYAGFASIGVDNPVPTSDPYFDPTLKPPKRDVAAAKSLLKDAGYPNGIDIPYPLIYPPGSPGQPALAEAIQQQVADAGIRFKLQDGGPTFWDTTWLHKAFYITEWNRRHPDEVFKLVFGTTGRWNQTHLSSKELDDAVTAAGTTTDISVQKQKYALAEHIVAEQDNTVLAAFSWRVHAQAKKVQGVATNFVYFIHFRDAYLS